MHPVTITASLRHQSRTGRNKKYATNTSCNGPGAMAGSLLQSSSAVRTGLSSQKILESRVPSSTPLVATTSMSTSVSKDVRERLLVRGTSDCNGSNSVIGLLGRDQPKPAVQPRLCQPAAHWSIPLDVPREYRADIKRGLGARLRRGVRLRERGSDAAQSRSRNPRFLVCRSGQACSAPGMDDRREASDH